ncbi:MAG: extracellular solute-binding protein [Christensenellales bacterium]|jgi:ABC-type glycerol-3-phosphate transport system substrate-binding protein
MIKKWGAWVVVGVILLALIFLPQKQGLRVQPNDEQAVFKAWQLLAGEMTGEQTPYLDYLSNLDTPKGTGDARALPFDEEVERETMLLDYQQTATYRLVVETAGLYTLSLDYLPTGSAMSDFILSIKVNDVQDYAEMDSLTLPLYWQSAEEDFPRDSYGDESAPRQTRVDRWRSQALNSKLRSTAQPLLFNLTSGENLITLTNRSGDGLMLGELRAMAPDVTLPDYAAYHAQHQHQPMGEGTIALNAVRYLEKNNAEAIFESVNNPALTPHDSSKKILNALSWGKDGTQVTYYFEVKTAGLYQISLHYRNDKPEFAAFHSILIDGQLPFSECESYAFPVTNGNWAMETLQGEDGTPFLFYLEAGTHTLSLRMEMAPVMQAWRYARLVSAHVMRFSLQVTELAGSQRDKNRTWKMTRYLPHIADYLDAYDVLLNHIKALTQDYGARGTDSAMFTEIDKALGLIEAMKRYPDEISLYTQQMTGPDNSIIVSLSRFATQLTNDAFSLDMVYVSGEGDKPQSQSTALRSLGNWFSTLYHTFITDKYRQTAGDGEVLTVWVNRALTHVDLLQKMVDTEFTARTGIKVKLSALTDPGKLTMSASAGTTPDVALGLASHMPFDLASRGALLDLSQFPDFWQVAGQMPPGTFVPYLFNEGVYAIPETLDFACLVYRRDIFENFNMQVPSTWDEVTALLPELQRYGMNFFHNIAQGTGYKWFYQTTPLIFQHGGTLYTPDGYRTAIHQPEAIAGIQALGNLFIAYSLDIQVSSFFDAFRYTVQPVGILDSGTYILLKNGAPELEGQWAMAPYPGTVQEDGSVSRWFIANGQGGIVFKDTQMKEEAWAFLKWWLSKETQVNYTFLLRSTYGDAFMWLPANVDALKDAPIDRADLDIILDSTDWLRDVPRTPGQYILERSISDIWNAMVTKGVSAQVAVDEKVVLINREIRKKMTELGFYDQDGRLLKPYVIRDYDWIKEQMDQAEGGAR